MSNETVVIVEDEIFLAMDMERILHDAGFRVAGIAADRSEALAIGTAARLAFVDINLRDGPTGVEIARRLADDHGVTVVYVTANPSQIDPRARGSIGVVAKPFRDDTIVHAAEIALGRRSPAEVSPAEMTIFADA
ncbi:MAG: response regulator [Phenylobacterium zucineum]|nr:MAG: response regulator [Phenylobacterium zucineum]